jgi:3-hydroxy-9,10-secoandrosta-1,3,5(10)-triene-9,17-dione monooxygenase reductase component
MSAASELPIDGTRFRHVLGHLPTGVVVVSANHESGPVGMASNSFTSVSLDPPLVLFCPARDSQTWPKIATTGAFAVNIFAAHQEEVSRRFAQRGIDRFDGVAWHPRAAGPALDDAVAWIECTIDAVHDGGDHLIVVGAVQRLELNRREADPLVFFRGRYGSFAGQGTRVASPGDRET